MKGYTRLLKVSTSKGKRMEASIVAYKDNVIIQLPFLEEVKKDNPAFSKNGIIRINCKKNKYKEVIEKITKYFEDLFLKGLADEYIHTSIGICINKGRDKRKNRTGEVKSITGKGSAPSVYISSGGNKPPESIESTGT